MLSELLSSSASPQDEELMDIKENIPGKWNYTNRTQNLKQPKILHELFLHNYL